jgi:hypothetical protein
MVRRVAPENTGHHMHSQLNAEDSILVDGQASPRGQELEVMNDPLMDSTAFTQLNTSRTAAGA